VEHTEPLHHNPKNAVTETVERVTRPDGTTVVRKVIGTGTTNDPHWATSEDPSHWNWWEREAHVYRSEQLRASLAGTGLDLPDATVRRTDTGFELILEDVAGKPGAEFSLDDHLAVASGLGRWQARPAEPEPWWSRDFISTYSDRVSAPWDVLDDDSAWGHPLVVENWPPGLREDWQRLLGHRGRLIEISSRLPRVLSHLDAWPMNQIRRPNGAVALVDWGFSGDGAIGEDLGNHIPDSVFDLMWPAADLDRLESEAFDAYLRGLAEGGATHSADVARLGMTSSAVKYTWLLPLQLAATTSDRHMAYHRQADADELFHARGIGLQLIVDWSREALALADRLGQ